MKKSLFSHVTSWVIRILLVVIVILTIGLLMLSTMGGTSDSHKKGLEQALSDSLKSDVELASIEEFNIMPQLLIKIDGVHGVSRTEKNEFMADKLKIAFSLADLATGKGRIEDFQLDNFRFSSDSEYDLRVNHAGIKAGQSPQLVADGQYQGRIFDVALSLAQEENSRISYYFDKENSLSGHYGSLEIKGKIIPATGEALSLIEDLQIISDNVVLANGHVIRDNEGIKVILDCTKSTIPKSAQDDFASVKKLTFVKMAEGCPP